MPRTESVLTIFLASPGDVVEERNRLEDSIHEWNKTWARNLGIRLELIRWENDAYSDVGVDAQDVINNQLPHDYDLFIGVMWSRFGTPTMRSGSGTVEEFDGALSRFRVSPDSIKILFYFKDTPIPPSKLDPSQLQKLQEFKIRLKSEGVFYWDFADTDQFDKLVSMHITKHVQSWRHRQREVSVDKKSLPILVQSVQPQMTSISAHEIDNDDDDDGYLDLILLFIEKNAEVNEILGRLVAAQSDLTACNAQGTIDLQKLVGMPGGADPAHAKRLIGKVAEEMIKFTARLNREIPLLRVAMNGSLNALTRAATLSVDFDSKQTREARTTTSGLLFEMVRARNSMIEFKGTTLALPRMTKDLNAAKRKQAAALDTLISEFANSEQLLVEGLKVIDSLIVDSE